jgi:ankyrin repeat protein
LLLQAYSFAPEPRATVQLPPDSLPRAVATQNPVLLEHSLAEGVDVNAKGAGGATALLLAVQRDHRELVQRLLDAGASVDVGDDSGFTSVMAVAARGDIELLRDFVARSTQIDAADSSNRNAAHHAIATGQYEAAKILVPLMPTMEGAGPDGRDLVAMACDSGDLDLITAAVMRATVPMEWSPHTRAALRLALNANNSELTRLLLAKHPAPPTVEGRSIPLLAHAIATDDRPLFDALLAAGADPNTMVPPGGDKEFLSLLGSNYVRDYVKGDSGITVLMVASGFAKPDYVRALLDAGAEKNRLTAKFKMMALYFAARTDRWRSVQMLLGSGTAPEKLRIEISLASQRASVIKDGEAVFQTPVSTGRAGFSTPAGHYVITDKQRSHKSSIYHVEMPFFMRLNCRDFGLHAGAVPNYPASHGCIRVPSGVAEKLFSEIPVGTVVMIN